MNYHKENDPSRNIRKVITSRKDVLNHLKDFLKDFEKGQEYMILLGFNDRCNLIYCEVVAMGGRYEVQVDQAVLFKRLILNDCHHFIIAHNHPSNDTSPSSADIEFTRKVVEGGNLLGVKLMDHIVFASDFSGYEGIDVD
jgi:DNA repair protein RadC